MVFIKNPCTGEEEELVVMTWGEFEETEDHSLLESLCEPELMEKIKDAYENCDPSLANLILEVFAGDEKQLFDDMGIVEVVCYKAGLLPISEEDTIPCLEKIAEWVRNKYEDKQTNMYMKLIIDCYRRGNGKPEDEDYVQIFLNIECLEDVDSDVYIILKMILDLSYDEQFLADEGEEEQFISKASSELGQVIENLRAIPEFKAFEYMWLNENPEEMNLVEETA